MGETVRPDAPTSTPGRVQAVYLILLTGNTLAASFIWGVNTLFLLDAGLTNFEAFAANAFFSLGMLVFEVPTGVVADMWGRRVSYLLGTLTLATTTALYWLLWLWESPFWAWAVVSILLGLGFTFFSGATEAWLVDALDATGYTGSLEAVFGRATIVGSIAMLVGSVAGGVIAQWSDLGVPFLVRTGVLLVMFGVAAWLMRDLGFTPARDGHPLRATRRLLADSVHSGLGNPPVRWLMLASPFVTGVGFYAFYAMQPYLLELWGDEGAYSIAGLAAALLSAAGILGGWLAPRVRRRVRKRTSVVIAATAVSSLALVALWLTGSFWVAVAIVVVWGVSDAVAGPVRQAYLNDLIPSAQRATVLSFDSLLGSAGGVVVQPALGRSADVWGYPASLALSGLVQAIALPFLAASRRRGGDADTAGERGAEAAVQPEAPPATDAPEG
ncbi:MFS transporter [Agromyces seonyuensis]|uniref:MFS transporter n=1 Tax=Agromyces seonyuensis TaxID=2662446 RepID=A0A6I4NXR2_9MICO|nr:MFS transporter [Agromyces seonyuensis]MWB99150.1 MFS transporter [Agromyces seonyuensis]